MKILVIIIFACLASLAVVGQDPPKDADPPFFMEVTDIFTISGMGTVVSGKIERGTIRVGGRVEIVGIRPVNITNVNMLMMASKSVQRAPVGSEVNLVLKGIPRDQLFRGQIVVKPGSVKAVTTIEATIEMFASHERGRNTPIVTGYRPQLVFRTVPFSGLVILTADKPSAASGTRGLKVTIELAQSAGLELDTKFSIRDNGREVGTGIVTALLDQAASN